MRRPAAGTDGEVRAASDAAGRPPWPAGAPPLPGGVGLTHLRVYSSVGPDGLPGGTPHLHTACTEAYVVVSGSGRVLTVGGDGVRETTLEPGTVAWFTPGTVHRLVNDSGDLEIWVLMQNGGLPEAGDMVITFPDDVLADPARYAAAAALPEGSTTTVGTDEPVRVRRDLAVEGYRALIEGGAPALAQLHRRAAALVAPVAVDWRPVWADGPLAATEATSRHLTALADGDGAHLAEAGVFARPAPAAERRHGCCGTLGVVVEH